MTDTITLSDGTDSIDLYYDTTGAGFQQIMSGMDFGIPPHQHTWHSSDFAEHDTITREKLGLRKWPMKLAIETALVEDNIANQLISLNRLTRKARKYSIDEEFDEVYLEIQLSSMTNWTRYTVLDIEYNAVDIMNYYNRQSGDVKFGDAVRITVITEPLGYGAQKTLKNLVVNPAFLKPDLGLFTTEAGAGTGWTSVGTPSTIQVSSIKSYYGGQSQKIITDADDEGVRTNIVSSSKFTTLSGYAWVYLDGSGTVTATLRDSVGSTDADVISTTTSSNWVKLSVTSSVSNNSYLQLTADSGTTFYVDKAYLGNHSSVPTAWSSYAYVKNHFDSGSGDINYIDIDGVDGDCEARTTYYLESDTSSNINEFYLGRKIDHLTHIDNYYKESVVASTACTSCSNESYSSTSVDTSWTQVAFIRIEYASNAMAGKWLLFGRIYDEGSDGTLYVRPGYWHSTSPGKYGPEVEVSSQGKWLGVPIGLINVTHTPVNSSLDLYFIMQAKRSSGATTADVRYDFLQLIPIDPACTGETSLTSSAFEIYLDSELQENWCLGSLGDARKNHPLLGTVPGIWPNEQQRLVFAFLDTDHGTDQMDINLGVEAEIRYRPQTEFLLGTD